MKPTPHKLRVAITSVLVAAASGGTGIAFAQDTGSSATTLDRVEVTGTRIRSVDAETSQPVLVLDREEIEKQGLTSVAEVLQRVSANGAGINRSFNNGGDGSAEISLRNLGSARTLVLVDGRRWVSSLFGSVDLNTVPAAIIERVEVLKDGASAIYGSDAIAGVVNIITRDSYDGAELRTHFGEFNQGDGQRTSVDATVGINGDRGNVVMSLSRVEEDEVSAGDRALSAVPLFGLGNALFSGFSNHGRIWNAGPLGTDEEFDLSLVVPPGSAGSGGGNTPRYGLDQFVPFSSDYSYNYAKDNYLLTPQTRTSAFMKGRYDITSNVTFRADAMFNERRSAQQLAGFPLSGGAALGNPANTALSGDSYFNPYNTDYGGDGRDVTWSHRLTERARFYEQNVKTIHAYVGLEGSFQFADRYFAWDMGYNFNKSDQNDAQVGDVNMLNLANAVGPSFVDADGIVRCGAPGAVIEGCVPFNPLSPAGGVTPGMLDYILFTAADAYQGRSESFTANISGDIMELPGGMMAFAAGIESRKESGFDRPDAFVAAGYTSGNARLPTSGSYDLDEVYAELLLPVLADVPGAQLLEFSLASRYSDYSNFGDTTNSKFGFKWKPVQDLLVRGNWSEGFRAPPIATLFRGNTDSYESFGDICSVDYVGRTETIAANCAAAGVPDDYLQLTNAGRGYGGQTVFPFTLGGNPDAGPETAESRTLGVVYSPGFVDGLDISLDWWNVEIEGALSTPTTAFVLDQCYAEGDQAFCDMIVRETSGVNAGVIIDMSLVPQNTALIDVEGWDMNVNYRLPETEYGNFTFNLDSAYMSKWEQQQSAASPVNNNVGQYFEFDPNWRLRANASLDWNYGPFGATWMSRYYSGLVESCVFPGEGLCSDEDRRDPDGPAPRNRMPATTYHDLQLRYDLPWDGTVKLGVNNLFKKDPPYSQNAFANSYDPQYDIPDSRYTYVEYVQRF